MVSDAIQRVKCVKLPRDFLISGTSFMKRTLLRSTGSFASMTLLSRITGFARDILIAVLFGASVGSDAFFVAFRIPNFMRRLFAEGAFSQAFVPVLSEWKHQRSPEETQAFINHIFGSLTSVLLLVVIIAELCTPLIIMVFAPGFHDEPVQFGLAVQMLRITFPYLLFISMTAMAVAVLNTHGVFGPPAFTPVLLNVSLIVAAVFFRSYFHQPIMAVAWGVFVAGILQLLFQWPYLWKIGTIPKLRWGFHDPGVRRVLKLMVPALFGVSVGQVNLMVDTIFASLLPVGSISWLYYSDRLMEFPLGMFGVAIATVILPSLSRKYAAKSEAAFAETLDWGLRSLCLVGIPASIGLMLLAGPVMTLLNHGAFTGEDVVMASKSLVAFAAGLPAFMAVKVLASGFYSRQNIKTPVKIAVAAMVCNFLLILVFIKPLAHAGLALASSLAAYLNAGLLIYHLKKQHQFILSEKSKRFLWQALLANAVMAAVIYGFSAPIQTWLQWHWLPRVSYLLLLISAAFVIYFFVLWSTGVRKGDFAQADF